MHAYKIIHILQEYIEIKIYISCKLEWWPPGDRGNGMAIGIK